MRYAKGHKEETRRRIVETASALFREKGVDGVGVDEIMRTAGLTHGGFYSHFGSKEELVTEACAAAVGGAADRWRAELEGLGPEEAFRAFVEAYLDGDCEESANCPIATLGSDVARRGEPVRQAYTEQVSEVLDNMRGYFGQSREEALMTFAALVGARNVANASGDPVFAEELLDVVRRGLIEAGPHPLARKPAKARDRAAADVLA